MEGQPILSRSGPITIAPEERSLTIAADGTISSRQRIVGSLRLVRFDGPLQAEGSNLFRSQTPALDIPTGAVKLSVGALEKSNVQSVEEMSRLSEVTRSYEQVGGCSRIRRASTISTNSVPSRTNRPRRDRVRPDFRPRLRGAALRPLRPSPSAGLVGSGDVFTGRRPPLKVGSNRASRSAMPRAACRSLGPKSVCSPQTLPAATWAVEPIGLIGRAIARIPLMPLPKRAMASRWSRNSLYGK